MTKESEVILDVQHVTPEDVYALGGFTGNVDQLGKAAADMGLLPEQVLCCKSELTRAVGQEWWLSEEKSRTIALRMTDFARKRYIHPPPVSS